MSILILAAVILAVVAVACWAGKDSDGTGGGGWDNWGGGGADGF